MNKLIIFLFFWVYHISNAQIEDSYQNIGFVSEKNYKLIENMTDIFEMQLCKHYNIKLKNAHQAFYKYTHDLKNDSIDIKKLASQETNNLLNKSIKNLLGYIWITNKNKHTKWNLEKIGTTKVTYENPQSKIVQEHIKELKATENFLSINYHTDFIKTLEEKTFIEDLKDIISTLKDRYSNDTPSLIALGLSNIKEEDFKDQNLKTFIAFELFYASLNTILNE